MPSIQSYQDDFASTVTSQIQEAPVSAVMLGFGVGLVVGCLLTNSITSYYAPRQLSTFEQVGRSVMNSLQNVLPESVSKHFA
jgi:predicted MFS family arabinose efflux permease